MEKLDTLFNSLNHQQRKKQQQPYLPASKSPTHSTGFDFFYFASVLKQVINNVHLNSDQSTTNPL